VSRWASLFSRFVNWSVFVRLYVYFISHFCFCLFTAYEVGPYCGVQMCLIRPHRLYAVLEILPIATDVCVSVCLSVCLSVSVLGTSASGAKTAEPIEMPFGEG